MQTVETIEEVRKQVKIWKKEGNTIGFVPTMGYLHEGHRSLMESALERCDKVVVSIFVNPMQFGVNEDFDSYPRDLEADEKLCEEAGVNLIFHPNAAEIYADGFCAYVDMDGLTKELCGKSRPDHFRGVCTVVSKLFHIVTPNQAFFGQKDAQQLAVIRRMVNDLNMDIAIVGCPIVREADGLAKSSRNTYLSREERKAALILCETVFMGERLVRSGLTDAAELVKRMQANLETEPLARIDYVEVVDFNTIKRIEQIQGDVLVAIAVYIGKTRLIDNFIVEVQNADTGTKK